MIDITKIDKSKPYNLFVYFYQKALKNKQKNIEACAISSFDASKNFVDSRFVNIKFIIDDKWIFFSNYESAKSEQFSTHNQISALFYWSSIDVQIRIKGKIAKTSKSFSDNYFKNRSYSKNALAISSQQSKVIESYDKVLDSYNDTLKQSNKLRPLTWGGYKFKPYSIEFWQGDDNRVNKRELYINNKKNWTYSILQP